MKSLIFFLLLTETSFANEYSSLYKDIFKYIKIQDKQESMLQKASIIKRINSIPSTQSEKEWLAKQMNGILAVGHKYQVEVWISAKLSYENKQVVFTQSFFTLYNDYINLMKKMNPNNKKVIIQLKKSHGRAKMISTFCAKRAIIPTTPNIDCRNLTTVNLVLNSLESQFNKLNDLFNSILISKSISKPMR